MTLILVPSIDTAGTISSYKHLMFRHIHRMVNRGRSCPLCIHAVAYALAAQEAVDIANVFTALMQCGGTCVWHTQL